ncbi:hypothetical protein P43SY_004545 [Pythium insidiosum]|uniref:KIF-binding protein n=1 Tax=Pythium insidiosum TaxID=114742 RepID=A0AAD5LR69_PYTIN|nr:hypothetical protein P43SY_004545 [Pythium insidiosum]
MMNGSHWSSSNSATAASYSPRSATHIPEFQHLPYSPPYEHHHHHHHHQQQQQHHHHHHPHHSRSATTTSSAAVYTTTSRPAASTAPFFRGDHSHSQGYPATYPSASYGQTPAMYSHQQPQAPAAYYTSGPTSASWGVYGAPSSSSSSSTTSAPSSVTAVSSIDYKHQHHATPAMSFDPLPLRHLGQFPTTTDTTTSVEDEIYDARMLQEALTTPSAPVAQFPSYLPSPLPRPGGMLLPTPRSMRVAMDDGSYASEFKSEMTMLLESPMTTQSEAAASDSETASCHEYCSASNQAHHSQATPTTTTTATSTRRVSPSASRRRTASGEPARRICRVEGCTKGIRSRGLCKAHGGGRRCMTPGCTTSDQGGGHCVLHGGGRRCSVQDCTKSAQWKGLCKMHGGARRCRYENCTKNGQVKQGYCRAHHNLISRQQQQQQQAQAPSPASHNAYASSSSLQPQQQQFLCIQLQQSVVRQHAADNDCPVRHGQTTMMANGTSANLVLSQHQLDELLRKVDTLIEIENPEETPFASHYEAITLLQQWAVDDGSLEHAVVQTRLGTIHLHVEEPHKLPVLSLSAAVISRNYTRHALELLTQSGILWYNRGQALRAMCFFTTSVQLCEALRSEASVDPELLLSVRTHAYFYLAQVYGALQRAEISARYCASTLRLQLESLARASPSLHVDAAEWVKNAVRLVDYFIETEQLLLAAVCLTVSEYVLREHASSSGKDEDDEGAQRRGEIAMAWARLHLLTLQLAQYRLLDREETDDIRSAKSLDQDTASAFEAMLRTLWTPENETYTLEALLSASISHLAASGMRFHAVNDVVTFDDAREVFKLGASACEAALQVFVLDGFVTAHVQLRQLQSQLYRRLVVWEHDTKRQIAMHLRRLALLTPLLSDQLNPRAFTALLQELYYEAADVATEVYDLKQSKKAGDDKAVAYAVKAVNWYQQYLALFYDPDSAARGKDGMIIGGEN